MPSQPEWLTANSSTAYPFTEEYASGIHELFVDAVVYTKYDGMQDGDTLVLTSYDFTVPAAEEIVLWNQDGDLVFASTTNAIAPDISTFRDWRMLDWLDEVDEIIVRVLLDSVLYAAAPFGPGSNAPLVARVWERNPETLSRIGVNGSWYDGDFAIAEGYNVDISVADPTAEGARRQNVIQLSGQPGSGLGRFTDCEAADIELRSINSIRVEDDGNFSLEGDGCYWFSPLYLGEIPVDYTSSSSSSSLNPDFIGMTPNTLVMHNDCEACCECEDYVEAYELVRYVLLRGIAVKDQVEYVKGLYDDANTNWTDATTAREGTSADLSVQCSQGFIIQVVTYFLNNTEEDVTLDSGFGLGEIEWNDNDPANPAMNIIDGSGWKYDDTNGWHRLSTAVVAAGNYITAGGFGALASYIEPAAGSDVVKPSRAVVWIFQLEINGDGVAQGDPVDINFTCKSDAADTPATDTDSDLLQE